MISDWQKDTETLPPGKRLDDAIVSTADLQLRRPVATDGPAITALVARCAPLDRNSAYCNLLQCTHFADSCIVAERDGAIVGWVSGHRPPSDPQDFFVWQVAVAREGRSKRLASSMIKALLARPAQRGATHLITTVTDDNQASWALFHGLARDWDVPLERSPLFESSAHFAGAHATEYQARIGPFDHGKFQAEQG
ncbi:diaminobutyrate acetyltransferase [Sphingopyxis lindanitolerans]|uniref:L-2,4-diaminobutyric acid acetyltransferase n=1 Tax=Sphingopyxis lindanitolerans TaxID=2054227 RepID=A0A2S8B4U4_9SPHN|nr:diaminobutyrate acetyltransferase [Sphingopyxis lindanitolerans]PQM27370.1 diaminobutyrate acetyltransferase [Sphingopyxis lindanitolerans]